MSNVDAAKAGMHAFAAGDAATMRAQLIDDFTLSGPVPVPLTKEQYIALSQAVHAGIPNWDFNVSQVEDRRDTVLVTVAVTGDQTGTLQGVVPGVPPIPPTGKHIQLPTEHLTLTFRGGQLAALVVDQVPGGGIPGVFAQIGHPLPPPPGR